MVASCGDKGVARFLRLVADAWEEKPSKFNLTPTGKKIILAWNAAYLLAGRREKGFCPFVEPTLREVKTQYAISARKSSQPIGRGYAGGLRN